MRTHSARGSGSKNAILGIVIVGALGVAGFIGYQNWSAGNADAKHLAMLTSAREYQQKVSRLLGAKPEQFENVNFIIEVAEPPKKLKGTINVTGRVSDQATMDALKAILAANPHPADLTLEVTVKITKAGG